jgi:hypothetical protein
MSDPRNDLFVDAIFEGPSDWKIRPVAEIYADAMIGGPQIYSGLVGFIWQVREDLAVDLAVRHAIAAGHNVNELRLGATVSLPVAGAHTAAPASPTN